MSSPTATPLEFSGAPAARMALETRPLGVDPDGRARWLVRVLFTDAQGRATKLLHGGDIDYFPNRGEAQWQTRARFDAPSAIVKTVDDGALSVEVRANKPEHLAPVAAATDTRSWRGPRTVAKALGPHLAQVGWFPRELRRTVTVVRSDAAGRRRVVGLIAAPSSTYRDTSVAPGNAYTYTVVRGASAQPAGLVHVPAEYARTDVAGVSGKGMWLFFSPSTSDKNAYTKLDPVRIVEQASRAGLHFIELRTAYGEYWEVTPEAKPAIDAIIDGAAERGIGVVGWTVPREATFDDLRQSVATAAYRTAKGNRFTGLAVDAERGEEYMGDGPQGRAALADYMRLLRSALGHTYAITATVEDPFLEKLSNAEYPYAAIAANADVLQPMTYWRMLSKKATSVEAARAAIRSSIALTLREARRNIRINVGGQTTDLSPRGSPPAAEIFGTLEESKARGAIGETFFDWDGTQAEQWEAIGRFRW